MKREFVGNKPSTLVVLTDDPNLVQTLLMLRKAPNEGIQEELKFMGRSWRFSMSSSRPSDGYDLRVEFKELVPVKEEPAVQGTAGSV